MKILETFVYIAAVGLACFFFGRSLPRELFCENSHPYKCYKWEKNGQIYNVFRVKKWKSKVPDMSVITNKIFPKRIGKMASEEMDRLVKESCVAEMVHYMLCIFAIGIYNIWKGKIGILLASLYILIGNVPYIIIQRYNRPNFISLRDKLREREERKADATC